MLKSLARDSMYSRLASRFASTAETNSSTETWSFAASSAARWYKSSGTAMLLLISPLLLLSSKTHEVSASAAQTSPYLQAPDGMRDNHLHPPRYGSSRNAF